MPRGYFQRGGESPELPEYQRHNQYHTTTSPSILSGKSGYSWTKRSSTFPASTFGGMSTQYGYSKGYNDMVPMTSPPTNGHSNFARASCAVCGEPLTTSFQGEKVIEPPDCPHVMHEQCYKEFSKDFQNCAICSKPLLLRRNNSAYKPQFGRNGSISHQSTASGSSSITNGGQIPDALPPVLTFGLKGPETEYEFDHADLEDPIDPCPDPIQIPDPRITLFPEHPAITSKSTAQTFTCLISVEVPHRRTRQPANVQSPLSSITETPSTEKKTPPPSFASKPTSAPSSKGSASGPNAKHLYVPTPTAESSHAVLEDLKTRVTDWHGLDTKTFGSLKMWENLKMGVDNTTRDVEVYLFDRLLLTVKEKNSSAAKANPKKRKYALKGFIYLEHINRVVDISAGGEHVLNVLLDSGLTREFTLTFPDPIRLAVWKQSLDGVGVRSPSLGGMSRSNSHDDEDSLLRNYEDDPAPSVRPGGTYRSRNSDSGSNSSAERLSSFANSNFNAPSTGLTSADFNPVSPRDVNGKPVTQRAAVDTVLVVSCAASMHGLKLQIMKDALKFVAKNLGDYDRMALVVFGGSSGPEVIAGMTRKNAAVWEKAIDALENGPRGVKTEVIEGVNLALDMLSKRRASNPVTSILVVSDSPSGQTEGVDQIVSQAADMDVTINTFGFGVTHRPQTLVELASSTGGMYNYCKEWMTLREAIGGCMGSLQSLSHQKVEVRLRVPATQGRIVKIQGADKFDIRPAGREALIELRQMYFGQRRDILVQMIIDRDVMTTDSSAISGDPWEAICRGLEAVTTADESSNESAGRMEELLLLECSLSFSNVLDGRAGAKRSNPSILTLPILPQEPSQPETRGRRPPPAQLLTSAHPAIVQRRVELLAADMLAKALVLAGRQENDAAHRLLTETRTILSGMTRGALPTPPAPNKDGTIDSPSMPMPSSSVVNPSLMGALEADLMSAAEWISHGTLFQRDFRKQILQQEQIIRSQRAFSFRTGLETYFATPIEGVRQLIENAREWSMSLDFPAEETED